MITHLDLCSGIGGFALAARWAGLQTIGFSEIDPWCQKVLAKHWPGVPIHGDLKTLSPEQALAWAGGRIDLITGGYPCQPFSLAGQRKGAADDRHLWPYILELIQGIRPGWCLFENVAGHITLGLDTVLHDLEAEGYSCWAAVIPALAAGARHRRDRVWIIASSNAVANSNSFTGWQELECISRKNEEAGQNESSEPASGCEDVANSHSAGWQECWLPQPIQSQYTAAECGSENISRSGWQPECSLGDSLDGVSRLLAGSGLAPINPWHSDWERDCPRVVKGERNRTNKLKALGNSIVPQIAYMLMVSMQAAEKVGNDGKQEDQGCSDGDQRAIADL